MKILKQTSNRLVCQRTPQNQEGLLASLFYLFSLKQILILAIPHLLLLYTIIQGLSPYGIEKLSCQRVEPTQINCKLTQSKFVGLIKGRVASLIEVRKARVDTIHGSENTTFHETVLLTQDGEIELDNDSLEDASRINDFVRDNNRANLVIDYDNRINATFPILFLVFPFLLYIGCDQALKMNDIETYIFNKTIGKLILQRWEGLSFKGKMYPLQNIIGVRVEKALDKNGVFIAYQASLLLRENNSLSFLFMFSSRNRETAQQFATTIAQFLNLPIITNNALYSGL